MKSLHSRALCLLVLWALSVSAAQAAVQTWWHLNFEENDSAAVAPQNVRRSPFYNVRVASAREPATLHDSFVYMSIPRNGLGKPGYTEPDGAEFSAQAGMTLSWSSFLYDEDVWVYVELRDAPPLTSAEEVTIRPTRLGLTHELVDSRTIRILVPIAPEGFRISIEFRSQLMTSYEDANGVLTTDPSGNRAVHTEPRHGLMLFAEPPPRGGDAERLVPDSTSTEYSIHYPAEGRLTDLRNVTDEVIYFRPGTYYIDANDHAELQPNVRWLYLAPGAYVKGAFQFHASPEAFPTVPVLTVSGFGVLSGEQYVYEADRANGYRHLQPGNPDCHGTCVKLLEFDGSLRHDHLHVHGITLANAPYHSFVIHGPGTMIVDASHGKQVGGWFWQSDGIEMYDDSRLSEMFFHLNDDVLKLYGRHGEIEDIVVWKLENGPVIQWGWVPRNLERIHVNGVDVIHNRMHWDAHNTCIINSARHYLAPNAPQVADSQARITDVLLANIRSEGMNLCAMRLYALSNWDTISIVNLWIEQWNELGPARQASRFEALLDPGGQRVSIGNQVREARGLLILNYRVGGERITRAAGNWQADRAGRLDFDASLFENWDAR